MFKILTTIAVLIFTGCLLAVCADLKAPEWIVYTVLVSAMVGICTIWDRRKIYDSGS